MKEMAEFINNYKKKQKIIAAKRARARKKVKVTA